MCNKKNLLHEIEDAVSSAEMERRENYEFR
jgi:hypothetical protein